MDNKQVTAEWIAQQREICVVATMIYEDAPACSVPLFKQFEESLNTALDALEAAWAEVARVKAERDAAVADCSGYCATCSFCGDCSKQDHNDAGEPSWCYGDCDCWEWRGVYAENTDAPTGAEGEADNAE